MDTRRSYYLAPRQDDFDIPAQDDEGWVDFADIPYVTPANDNISTKGRLLSARVGTWLLRLIALHGLNWSF
jgi:hypothetical protein